MGFQRSRGKKARGSLKTVGLIATGKQFLAATKTEQNAIRATEKALKKGRLPGAATMDKLPTASAKYVARHRSEGETMNRRAYAPKRKTSRRSR